MKTPVREMQNCLSSPKTLAVKIYEAAHIQGQFKLRSGLISDEYFDKYLFETDPELLREIGQALQELLPPDVEALAGLEMGGIPIATMLSQITGIPTLFVRKQAKEYGTRKLAEGGDIAGRNLVIVEDVVTSGGQIRTSAQQLRELGSRIVRVIGVIDRESGGTENLAQDALELKTLFTITELKDAAQQETAAKIQNQTPDQGNKQTQKKVYQGDVYWVPLREPDKSYTHPHVVIQDDILNHSRINTIVVCALTTNMKRAKNPGNVLLEAGEANLPKQSIVVVSQVSTVEKAQLGEYIGSLSEERIKQVLTGMKFLQSMTERYIVEVAQ